MRFFSIAVTPYEHHLLRSCASGVSPFGHVATKTLICLQQEGLLSYRMGDFVLTRLGERVLAAGVGVWVWHQE
jgi:hypothetical protein